jgi:hypothetical protein
MIKFQIYKLDKDSIDENGRYVPEYINAYGYGMSQYLPQGKFKWNKQTWTEEKNYH